MKPEEKARVWIDRQLEEAGWRVVSRDEFSASMSAAAVTEGLMKGGLEADYLLFLNGKAIGVVEAKADYVALDEVVSRQAENYAHKPLSWYPVWEKPLPLIYLSNGKDILFKNLRNPETEYVQHHFHTPKEMVRLLGIEEEFAGLPTLQKRGLRDCQYDAITNLEQSFREGYRKALIVLATGAGKTYTACMATYRLLSYTSIKRVLFLVDRNNLGKQAEGEFGAFRLTENGEPFNTIFETVRLKSKDIPENAEVVICTIQRLFSALTGQEMEDDDFDGTDVSEGPDVELCGEVSLPKDFFNLIIVDECHRSIYGRWKKVLEYFGSARIIGLTATPVEETMEFFNHNCIENYTLEKSIVDGVNVDCRIYRIKTEVSEYGGLIKEGERVLEYANYTGEQAQVLNDNPAPYASSDLNRSVINPEQIRTVLRAYKDAIYTDLYPERKSDDDAVNWRFIPKTLIFAANDMHATDIVEAVREIFPGQTDTFVQKITYSAGDSNELIRSFRNDKDFRIAVTVTLVATGTDVKPLEVLLFMRDVNSEPLFIQMKGRGVRTISDDVLQTVTPNASSKDLFYLVDAVGVTEHVMNVPGASVDPGRHKTLRQLLEQIRMGYIPDDNIRLLASFLSRVNHKAKEKHKQKFTEISGGYNLKDLAEKLYFILEFNNLPPFVSASEPNKERKDIVEPFFSNTAACEYLCELNAGFKTTLLDGEDQLISAGFSVEEATRTTEEFEQFVNLNKDEIEALRLIHEDQCGKLSRAMLEDLRDKLFAVNRKFMPAILWNSYRILKPENVEKFEGREEAGIITNIIQLVRYAYHKLEKLQPLTKSVERNFNLWCGQEQRTITQDQRSLLRSIISYVASNGALTRREIGQYNIETLAQLVQAFGTKIALDQALESMYSFIFRAA